MKKKGKESKIKETNNINALIVKKKKRSKNPTTHLTSQEKSTQKSTKIWIKSVREGVKKEWGVGGQPLLE